VADRLETPDPTVPPPAEVIHMPEPSYLPAVLGLGLTIALVGLLMNIVVIAIGVVIAGVAFVRWVGKARAEMAELPLEHRH
jgi:uncharacterized membrane protein